MWLSCPWLDLCVPNHKSNWTCQARTCEFVISVYGSMGLSFRWFWSMCATLDIKLCMLVKNTCNDSSRHFRWYLDIAFLVGSLCLFCLLWPQSVRLGWTNCGWICWRKERMNEANGCTERWNALPVMVEIELELCRPALPTPSAVTGELCSCCWTSSYFGWWLGASFPYHFDWTTSNFDHWWH